MSVLSRRTALVAGVLAIATPFVSADDDKPKITLEIRKAETKPAKGLKEAPVLGSDRKVYLHEKAELTNADILIARPTDDGQGGPAIEIVLTKDGAKKMGKLTAGHKDKPLAILVNGKVISAPTVKSKITEKALITGTFTKKQVDELIKAIAGK